MPRPPEVIAARTPKPAPSDDARIVDSLRAIRPEKFGFAQARHLLWRAGLGGTSRQVETLVSWGPEKAVDYLLNPEKIEPQAWGASPADQFDRNIMRPPTPDERRLVQEARKNRDEDALAAIQKARQEREKQDREQVREMQKWWLRRMIETPRPLEEKMTLFWHGHFATSYRKIENSYHMFMQNEMLRANALGNFGNLLRAIIRDPAMIAYLDNNNSRKGKPNENLAREIMELFSLGLGNYTEQDIKEGARALTGYSFDDDAFKFDSRNHDRGDKRILGKYGELDGDGFVAAILDQDACAKFIVRKIYAFFVADVPPDERGGERSLPQPQRAAISELANSLRLNNYELKPMLRRMFLSEHFYSPRFMNEQIKSPAQLVVGAIRSLHTPVRDLSILADAMDKMGQNLLLPPSVKGWEGGRAWINTSTMFIRQNVMAFLVSGRTPKGFDPTSKTDPYDATQLITDLHERDPNLAKDPEAVSRHLLTLTLGRVPEGSVDTLLAFFDEHKNKVSNETLTGAILLITAMPEYQLC